MPTVWMPYGYGGGLGYKYVNIYTSMKSIIDSTEVYINIYILPYCLITKALKNMYIRTTRIITLGTPYCPCANGKHPAAITGLCLLDIQKTGMGLGCARGP